MNANGQLIQTFVEKTLEVLAFPSLVYVDPIDAGSSVHTFKKVNLFWPACWN